MFATRFVFAMTVLAVCAALSSAQPIAKTPLVVKLDAVGLPDGAKQRLGKITGYRYTGQAGAALMSPDAKLLAVSDNNGNGILILDPLSGKMLQRLQGQVFPGAGGMSFSPDGKAFAIESFGQDLRVFDVATGKQLKQFQHRNQNGGRQNGPSFSKDGKVVCVGGERFVPKGNQEGLVKAWDVATGKEFGPFTSIHNYNIHALVAPDGKTMISFGQTLNRGNGNDRDSPRTIQVWDLATGKEARKIMLELGPQGITNVVDAAFAPDGKTLAVTTGMATFHLLEFDTGKEIRRFSGQRGMGGSLLQYSPDGELLVVHDRYGGAGSVIQAWEIKTGKRLDLGDGPKALLMGVAFPGKNRITAFGTLGQSLCWWDATADEKTSPFQGHLTQIAGLAFTDAGNTLITAGNDQRLFWWDWASGKQTRELRLFDMEDMRYGYGGGGGSTAFALAPNGRYAASSSNVHNGGVRLWNLKTGRAILDLEGPQSHSMPGIAFSPDSSKLAATGTVFPFHIWNIETGQELPKMPGAKQQNNFGGGASSSAAFSPDGKTVAIHLNQFDRFTGQPIADLILWDVPNGKLMHRFKVPMINNNFDGRSSSGNMAFSNDGQLLAVSNGVGAIVLYTVASGREWRKIDTSLRNSSFQLAFSPDGRFIAAGGSPRFLGGFGNIKMDEPAVEIWELAGSLRREQFKGHTGAITCLAYAPDGATLATGSTDTTLLLWDLTGKSGPKMSPLEAEELPQAWKTLAGNDPAAAGYIRRMIAAPEPTVAFLKNQFLPIKGEVIEEKTLDVLVHNLDSGNFKTRTLATKELQRLGERAEAALRKALAAKPSVEMTRRIDDLLDAMKRGNFSPTELQAMRGVEVLERIGTDEAREWLTALAQGDPVAQATREAKLALKRMK